MNGKVAGRDGNRLSYASPHGVYPARGVDRWVAIAVFTDQQWQDLCEIMGKPEVSKFDKYNTLLKRKNNEDELDKQVALWTSQQDATDIEVTLQNKGIPVSIVLKSSDLFEDPQLHHRKFYVRMKHAEMGTPAYQQQADYILSKTPRETVRPSPCLGEHNEYVYKELLGLSDDDISDRIADGSITIDLPQGFQLTTNM